ncbi:hypothetical protein OG478_13790 [Streptomyces phaeochromogenes]|nr:hypothetical protein OG478_13790 [Streptomyces phaeochromogenes]
MGTLFVGLPTGGRACEDHRVRLFPGQPLGPLAEVVKNAKGSGSVPY